MFSGLIRHQGVLLEGVTSSAGEASGKRLWIFCPDLTLTPGGSIAVNGVCLTAAATAAGRFAADLSPETLAVTTLGTLPVGARLNLELPLTPSSLLDGHLFSGHVDATATIKRRADLGQNRRLWFTAPDTLLPLIAVKGSIAIDGVSLTVNEVDDCGFTVMLIPHTLAETNLATLAVGDRVNLESDLIARYVARWLACHMRPPFFPGEGRCD